MINAQDLINAHAINKTNMTYKVKKRTGWELSLKLINAVSNKLAQGRFFLENKHVLILGRLEYLLIFAGPQQRSPQP